MPSQESRQADDGAPTGPDGQRIPWEAWPGRILKFPDDLPLHGLMLAATRVLGLYGQQTIQAAGLKASVAGLGMLRVLMAGDGIKSTELAEQAMITPGTATSVVNTLVKDGFVERRPDDADRRVVRLYITGQGRAVITQYVTQAAGEWRKAFDFVDEADEAVVRRFFLQMIDHVNQLLREERGT